MKKLIYLIVLALILGLVLTGCTLLSNIGQTPTSEQSGITYLTKNSSPPGLVGLWHFDEEMGATVVDSSGNGNDGNVYEATTGVSGKFGNALSFDGNSDYVEFGSVVTGLIGGDYTVEAWIKPASLDPGRHAVMSFSYMELGYDAGKVYFWQAYDNSWGKGYKYMSPTVLLDITEFSHIVGVFHEDAGVDLYVDGNYIGSDTTRTGTSVNIFGNTYAGVWYQMPPVGPGGAWFDGTIDEVRIWDGALTSTQISQSFALGTTQLDATVIELGEKLFPNDQVVIFTSSFYGLDATCWDYDTVDIFMMSNYEEYIIGVSERNKLYTPKGTSGCWDIAGQQVGTYISVVVGMFDCKSIHLSLDLTNERSVGFNAQFLPYD